MLVPRLIRSARIIAVVVFLDSFASAVLPAFLRLLAGLPPPLSIA